MLMAGTDSLSDCECFVDHRFRKRQKRDGVEAELEVGNPFSDGKEFLEWDKCGITSVTKNAGGSLASAATLMNLKTNSIVTELLKLPRFGPKIDRAPADENRLRQRLEKIYRSKYKAFRWPRFCEVSLGKSKDALSSKSTSNMVGQLHLPEMTVWVERFRGSFSQQFGSPRFDHASNSMKTELNPWEAFFLADMGSLEITNLDNCTLSIEDFRAILEANVPKFVPRYGIFSEIHRGTQLYLRLYGVPISRGFVQPASHDIREKSETQARSNDCELPLPEFLCNGRPFSLDRTDVLDGGKLPTPSEARSLLKMAHSASDLDRYSSSVPSASSFPPRSNFSESSTLEIPPVSFTDNDNFHFAKKESSAADNSREIPSSFDLVFTAFHKIPGSGPAQRLFDVAVTDYREKDIPMADLFLALKNRDGNAVPLYVVRDDVGSISGFSAVLADVPSVVYDGRFV